MPEDQLFRIGAEVSCTDGEICGEIRYLVVNPDTRRLRDLAVEEKGRQGLGRLVPFGDVRVPPDRPAIEFLGTMADFRELEAADATEFAPGTVGYELYGTERVTEEPGGRAGPGEVIGDTARGVSYSETFDEVPPGNVEIRRHDPVYAGGHKLGQVQGVLIDPVHHHVTRVLLQTGHLLTRKEVAIPVGHVMEPFGKDGIRLKISRQDVESLPPWDSDQASRRPAGA